MNQALGNSGAVLQHADTERDTIQKSENPKTLLQQQDYVKLVSYLKQCLPIDLAIHKMRSATSITQISNIDDELNHTYYFSIPGEKYEAEFTDIKALIDAFMLHVNQPVPKVPNPYDPKYVSVLLSQPPPAKLGRISMSLDSLFNDEVKMKYKAQINEMVGDFIDDETNIVQAVKPQTATKHTKKPDKAVNRIIQNFNKQTTKPPAIAQPSTPITPAIVQPTTPCAPTVIPKVPPPIPKKVMFSDAIKDVKPPTPLKRNMDVLEVPTEYPGGQSMLWKGIALGYGVNMDDAPEMARFVDKCIRQFKKAKYLSE